MNEAKKKTRRRYDAELKQQILVQCAEPGASVASIALSHGINANVVHKWRREGCHALPALQAPAFVPVPLPPAACAPVPDIRIELRRGATRASVTWPDALWLATEPLDMRAGTETALARVVSVFGAARPHHAYLFANRRANRMKVLVHDGIGVWLAARRQIGRAHV